MVTMNVKPSSKPTTGERTTNTAIFWNSDVTSAAHPALATAAPAIAPTSACDEDVGRPKSHVMMSHAIAPTRPAKMTLLSNTPGFTVLAIVAATFVPNTRNATKLKKAAHTAACRGESTLVDTTVAMEFAASWNPLKKSNARATATTKRIA